MVETQSITTFPKPTDRSMSLAEPMHNPSLTITLTHPGLSKEQIHDDDDRAYSYVGTVEYMAPEIVEESGVLQIKRDFSPFDCTDCWQYMSQSARKTSLK